jgi:photosystem II stability/assembly factor-like uncharacterized protein
MVKSLIISASAFALFTSSVLSDGLNDVCAPSINRVFAVGNQGVILKSTNAGNTYTKTVIGADNLNSVYGINRNLWAVGENGSFLKSADDGVSWSAQNIASSSMLSVFFTDSLTGYVCGAQGLILKSSNGGENWVSLSSGTSNTLKEIKFINSATGFACGLNSTALKTTDAGWSWTQIATGVSGDINSIDIFDNLIVAGVTDARILKSTDLGQSWSLTQFKIYTKPAVVSICAVSSDQFHVFFESGAIWYTLDTGKTFSYSRTPLLSEISSAGRIFTRLYAVSKHHNVVIKASESPTLWNFPSNTSYNISFVLVLNPPGVGANKIIDINYQKRGIMYVGAGNKLLRSSNFGLNWSQISTIPSNALYCQQLIVSKKDSTKMITVLNSGGSLVFYRTTNYGLNWDSVFSGYTDVVGNLIAQDPTHPDTVYTGIRDSVMKSTDFGLTWAKIAEGSYLDWCDIAVHPTNSRVLYGSVHHYPARIMKSSDGGNSWITVDLIFDTNYSEMPAIATTNLNPNVIFHAQLSNFASQNGLKRSYSQGNSWLFDLISGYSWAVDIAKDDPNVYAYGNVSSTPVYISTNGGINYVTSTNQYAEQIFFYDKSNLFVTRGAAVYKMVATYNTAIGIQPVSTTVPKEFSLSQNYPNPFNPATNINFDIAKSSQVNLKVFDILGREVIELLNEQLEPGSYKIQWEASAYPSGVYFYKLETGNYRQARKMVLIK